MGIEEIIRALEQERTHSNKGSGFKVLDARWEENSVVVTIEPLRTGRSTAIDESLEGSRAVWGPNHDGRGEVFVTNADTAELVLRFTRGPIPNADDVIWLYPRDFLTPLVELWSDSEYRKKAIRLIRRKADGPLQPEKQLPKKFSSLRSRQAEAVKAALYRSALVIGPPGTGKTYTVGATVAYLLTRFVNARVLLIGPTNVAVDTALLSADDWLAWLRKDELRATMKRIGSHFDARKYKDRQHLLASGIYDAATELSALELDEPRKADVRRYVAWKEKVERARSALNADVASLAGSSRLIALTSASTFIWYAAIHDAGRWHFEICDESSQITMPAALMLGAMAQQVLFAGDPNQLSPIVQSADEEAQRILTKTAFDIMKPRAKSVQLNEQSRMCVAICDAISETFYGGDLKVAPRDLKDPDWKKARSPWYVDGREVPRIMFDERAGGAQWSKKYNGFIRFDSAKIVDAMTNELIGSYVDEKDVLVLTPFRAQRALIRAMFKGGNRRGIRVSTVHRSQGTESKIVIFDPVDACSPFLNSENGKRLINVAISRAQAHVAIMVNARDLENPYLRKIYQRSRALWHTQGNYATPFKVPLKGTAWA